MTESFSGPTSWLVVVDMQPAFGHPESPWFTPGLEKIADSIDCMLPLFGDRVVFTRFLPPATLQGSWARYYTKWPFALRAEHDWLWSLLPRWHDRPSISSHQFSKWNPDLRSKLGACPSIFMCGVATDCCVLGTALGAVDDGAHVRIIEDGCAAKTPEVQDRAIRLLAARSPQLEVVTIADTFTLLVKEG